jgi:hypothetical protein
MGLLDIRKALKVSQASRKWHCDVGNSGLSAILALGDYTGGVFETEAREVDIHNAILIMDGSKPHKQLVWFPYTSYPKNPLDAAYLSMLGVPLRNHFFEG